MLSQAIWSVPIAAGLAYAPVFARAFVISRFGGKLDNTRPRDIDAQVSNTPEHVRELAGRLKASHANQLETLGLYAAGVAIAVAVRVPPPELARLTGWYIKSRLAYNLAYAAPQIGGGALRSLTFFAAMTSCVLLYAAAARTGAS